MTVSASAGYSGPYLPNGITVAFPFTFSAASAGEVQVQLDGVIVSTGFTVTLNSNQATNPGGTVTFTTAPTGDALAILSNPDFSQEIAFTNAGPFSASSHDEVADQSARKDIALKRDVDRSLKVDLGATPPDYDTLRVTLKGDPGGYPGDIGLFTQAPYLDIATGINVIATSGYSSLDKGSAIYVYDATVNAAYVTIHPRSSFMSANGRGFRLSLEQEITPEIFGAKGDWVGVPGSGLGNGTDDYAAFAAMLAFISAENRNNDGVSKGGRRVLLASPAYFLSDTFDLKATIHFQGFGDGMAGGFDSRLVTAADKGGWRVHVYNSMGTAGPGAATTGAGGTTFDRVTFESLGGTPNKFKAGLWLRNRAAATRCRFINWPGPGMLVRADVNGLGDDYGNANGWEASNCRIDRCGYGGLVVELGDTNAGSTISMDISGCARYGLDVRSFLGSGIYDVQVESCGVNGAYGLNQTSVVYGGDGFRYRLKHGQDASGAGTAPTSGTSNSVWECIGAGGVHAFFPLYSTYTGTYVSGGSRYILGGSARAADVNGYDEGDCAPGIATEPSFFVGGQHNITDPGVSHMYGGADGMACTTGWKKRWTDPGTGKIIETGVGGDDPLSISFAFHTDYAPNKWRINFGVAGYRPADLFLAYQNATGFAPWSVTGPTTVEQFGRGAAQPYYFHAIRFALGGTIGADDSRVIAYGAAAPTTGAHARGEIVLNNTPTLGGKVGWQCTASGTPGTWVVFGIVGGAQAATSSATYVAPAGGATVDTEGRASLAQLAADLADMKAKLQTGRTMA